MDNLVWSALEIYEAVKKSGTPFLGQLGIRIKIILKRNTWSLINHQMIFSMFYELLTNTLVNIIYRSTFRFKIFSGNQYSDFVETLFSYILLNFLGIPILNFIFWLCKWIDIQVKFTWKKTFVVHYFHMQLKWAPTCDFQQCGMCDQQSVISAWVCTQSDQHLC